MAEDNAPVAIKVNSVSKDFALPHEQVNTMKGHFMRLFSGGKRGASVQHALKGVSFEVKKGEFFGIVGRNGSGKSTLLKILAGIYQPTNGGVQVKGKLVPFIELGVGFNPELTGRENVYLNGALLGFSKKEMESQYKDIVAFAELEDFMDQKLKNYSSGMQVRLAFSVAIIADADILLVDEVLAVGDADFKRKCYEYFKSLKKNKKTVIFVSHDMAAINEYCDRALLINDSEVIAEGKANTIANEYLRLFNAPDSGNKNGSDGRRWGVGGVKIKSMHSKLENDNVRISMKLKAEKDIEDVVAGIRIVSSAGEVVTGTNTQNLTGKLLNLSSGEELELAWEMLNIFSTGTYTIDATIRLSDAVTICDNWDGAGGFAVKRKEQSPYQIVPPMKLTAKKK